MLSFTTLSIVSQASVDGILQIVPIYFPAKVPPYKTSTYDLRYIDLTIIAIYVRTEDFSIGQ